MRRSAITLLAVPTALLALGLAACSGDADDPGRSSSEPPSSSEASEASETTEASEATDGTTSTAPSSAPSSPTVAPADGEELRLPHLSLRAPRGWEAQARTAYVQLAHDPGNPLQSVYVGDSPRLEEVDLRSLAESTIEGAGWVRKPRIDPDATLGGVPAYHLSGPIHEVSTIQAWGGYYEDRVISIWITMDRDTPEAEAQALVDSVMATFEWR